MELEDKSESKIIILGSGPMGIILSSILSRNAGKVYLWYQDGRKATELNKSRIVYIAQKQYRISDNVIVTSGYDIFQNGNCHLQLALPSRQIEDILDNILPLLDREVEHSLSIFSKGILSLHSIKRWKVVTVSEYIEALTQKLGFLLFHVAFVSGPSLISELTHSKYSFFHIGCKDPKTINRLKKLYTTDRIHITSTDDIVGVELGGVLKNPIAIGSGIVATLPECGCNTQGEFIAIGFQEMLKLGVKLGARMETLMGRAGLADVITTSMTPKSRNYSYGVNFTEKLLSGQNELTWKEKIELFIDPSQFIKNEVLEDINLVEGVFALGTILHIAKEKGVELPFYQTIFDVLARRIPPESLIYEVGNVPVESELPSNYLVKKTEGMHNRPGHELSGLLEKRVLRHVVTNRNVLSKIKKQIHNIQEHLEGRLEAAKLKNVKKDIILIPQELKLWKQFEKSSPENESMNLEALIRFYVNEIADKYHPVIRETLIRVLAPVRFMVSGFKIGSAIPIIGGKVKELKALASNYNILYAPTHRTHIDSIEIAFGLTWQNLPVPRYASNIGLMNDPFWDWLIKSLGAYSVDRDRTRNFLYLDCLTLYSTMMLEVGIPSLVYPEGTRSRNGKIEPIKVGLLSTAINAYKNTGSEILIVPLTISYENIPEDEYFSDYNAKVNFKDFISKRTKAYMDICEPIHVSHYVNEENPIEAIAIQINSLWKKNYKILPNHIMCKLLAKNDYYISMEEVIPLIDVFISSYAVNYLTRNAQEIKEVGIKNLLKRDFAVVQDNYLKATKRKLIDYYANMVPDSSSDI
ncbi:MAG: 1-acyl-sn-glycerol-3-phosphate acyltransferase [Leptospiraceae bacterium]|nr:1-acyl-sn-glycerol-3-phosphate acyltransferase [Leptospiraceae bacterium]MCP5493702.1 1-acyl-sn-glycerol-3-phosphate acyltransferase [Leptospiraceae bacterium]